MSLPYISCNSQGTKQQRKKPYLGITKNTYQVQFISVVNLNLFVWFMKVKVYKVESCTVYFSLNFHSNFLISRHVALITHDALKSVNWSSMRLPKVHSCVSQKSRMT